MIYIFNESFDIESGYDRYRMHEIIDQMYELVLINVDGELEVDDLEYLDVSRLDFDYGELEASDFDLSFATAEELLQEQEELHNLISNRDVEGLAKFVSSLPLEIKKEEDVSMKELLESGQLEEKVKEYVESNYSNYYVDHSKSCVASNSFYIKNEDDEAVLKISDHNTIFQEVQYGTEFINVLGEFGVPLTFNEVIEQVDSHLQSN